MIVFGELFSIMEGITLGRFMPVGCRDTIL